MIPLIGAHDFPYIFSDQVKTFLSWPLTWGAASQDSLGVFSLSTLWDWPYGLLYGILGTLGIDFTVSTWAIGILPVFVLGWLSMGKLLKNYGLSKYAQMIGQIIFIANTYVLMLIDGGQLSLAIAYSLLPLAIYHLKNKRKFILVTAVISFLDIRYIYLLFLLIGVQVLFDLRNTFKYLMTGLLTGIVLIGLHSYWLLPSIFTKGPALPSTYTRLAQVSALSFATLSHAMLLLHPNWPQNIFGKVNTPSALFIVFPLLAFLPIFIYKKHAVIAFWTTVALIAIFFAKGSNPPLGYVYDWFFAHIPGFSLFRDPTKFFPLIALSYSVLVAFSTQLFKKQYQYLIIIIYLIFLIIPITHQATGLFSFARDEKAYQDLASYLQTDKSDGGILWVPSKPPLGYGSPSHLSMDALTLLDKRPFATGVVGSYELLNFLRDATYSGQLLDISGVKYVAISSLDPKRDSLKKEDISYHDIFTKQLSALPWVGQVLHFGQVTLLQTKSHQPLFYSPQSATFVVGSDDIYQKVPDLSQNGLVFTEEQPGLLENIANFPNANIYLNHKSNIDLAAGFINAKNLYFPDSQLNFSPDSSGWWKREAVDLISWRDFLQSKYGLDNQDFSYGGGWSVSEGSHTLIVRPQSSCQKDCVLLARAMNSSKGGRIVFSTNGSPIGSINTYDNSPAIASERITGYQNNPGHVYIYSRSDFVWQQIGGVSSGEPISVSTSGDINVVNALAIISLKDWQNYLNRAQTLISEKSKSSPVYPEISYKQIGPDHYRIGISNLSGPGLLVFQQNFDPFWRLSGQHPILIDSLLNGFSISKNGQYDLIFLPQEYVLPGLVLSALTLVLFMLLLRM